MEAGSLARDAVGMEHSLSLPPVTLSEATRSVAESKGPIRFGTTVPTAAHHTGASELLPYESQPIPSEPLTPRTSLLTRSGALGQVTSTS